MKKWLIVAGARPNFMKIAPIVRAVDKVGNVVSRRIVHTGQHYDYNMSMQFFEDLEIPLPHYFLEVGSGSHAQQTGMTMIKFEEVCEAEKPDLVVVVGDVNATLACALAAKKLNVPIAHVEAGIRSFDDTMPEEVNRIITDRISKFRLCTEESGVSNLRREGITKKVFNPGDVMVDSLRWQLAKLCQDDMRRLEQRVGVGKYALLTMHRNSNVDDMTHLSELVNRINEVADIIPVVFPVHPRTKRRLSAVEKLGQASFNSGVKTIDPVSYRDMVTLLRRATVLITDSGGMQVESSVLEIPCLTMRDNTEQWATLTVSNRLVGQYAHGLAGFVKSILDGDVESAVPQIRGYALHKESTDVIWDGNAAERIVKILIERHS